MRWILIFILSINLFASNKIDKFIDSAKEQIGVTKIYDPRYVRIKYPMGDVPIDRGVCTDVVVRALRSVGIDLQKEIYLDKKRHPARYRGLYYTDNLDPNIDHRRVKNIQAYLSAKGYRINGRFRAGDIVVWKLPGSNLDHIGICSKRLNRRREPYIIHNIGYGTKEEDVLRDYIIVDHFRVFK